MLHFRAFLRQRYPVLTTRLPLPHPPCACPAQEASVPFRVQLGERECRQCNLTLRMLEGVRVRDLCAAHAA